MQPSLDDSYFRVKRAGDHIRAIRLMQRSITIDPEDIIIEPRPESEKVLPGPDGVRRVPENTAEGLGRLLGTPRHIVPPPPPSDPRWAVRFGECIYNLRAALDYLVYSLAYLDGGREREGTQFPICSSPDKFKKAIERGYLRGIKRPHRTAIKCLQPYPGRHGVDPFWLAQLREFSNPDKHRHLAIVGAQTRTITTWPIPGAFTDSTNVQFTASRFISLGDADKTPLIPTLDSLRSHGAETLDQFKSDFP